MMTLGFLRRLHEEHKQVPRDYSIVSYDDSLQNYLFGIELTTIVQDIKVLAKEACQLMFGRLRKESAEKKEVILPPKLKVRNSVWKWGL